MKIDQFTIRVTIEREGFKQESFDLTVFVPQQSTNTQHLSRELKDVINKGVAKIIEETSAGKPNQ